MKSIVSASRRIDMLASCPQKLLTILEERFPPKDTHTLVLWTKTPGCLVGDPVLTRAIGGYDSVFLHATVTGMGGSRLEPRVPGTEEVMASLEEAVDFVGGPEHVALRFDPVVHLKLPDGTLYSNLHHFEPIVRRAARLGIGLVIVSWMQVYKKVARRLEKAGVEAVDPAHSEWEAEARYLRSVADRLEMDLRGCCVPGWPTGACIDAGRFQHIHPGREKCSRAKARGQRDLCGCSHSVDIGWYGPCVHGCLYCYANPTFYGESLDAYRWPE